MRAGSAPGPKGMKGYLQARLLSLLAKAAAELPEGHLRDLLRPHRNPPDLRVQTEVIAATLALQYLQEHNMTCSLDSLDTELGPVPEPTADLTDSLGVDPDSPLHSLLQVWSSLDSNEVKRTNFLNLRARLNAELARMDAPKRK
jgi:hypothetical protein